MMYMGYLRNFLGTTVAFTAFQLGAFLFTFYTMLPGFCKHDKHGSGWGRTVPILQLYFTQFLNDRKIIFPCFCPLLNMFLIVDFVADSTLGTNHAVPKICT